jgi:amidase
MACAMLTVGYQIIEWKPPSHSIAADLCVCSSIVLFSCGLSILTPRQDQAYTSDGGADIVYHFGLSGEEPAPQIIVDTKLSHKTALEVAALNVKKREYQKLYMEYWNSTAELTGTGRPVDGLICPCAPHAAVIPQKYRHVGYTEFVNLLDYTSVAFPVTRADKTIDVSQPRDEFLSEVDKLIYEDCELILLTPGVNFFKRLANRSQTMPTSTTVRRPGFRSSDDDSRRRKC